MTNIIKQAPKDSKCIDGESTNILTISTSNTSSANLDVTNPVNDIARLQELLNTDYMAFLKEIRRSRKVVKKHSSQTDFLADLMTITPVAPMMTPVIPDIVPEITKTQEKKNSNDSFCEACNDVVTLLPRENKKTAYTEVTTRIRGAKRIIYWCQPCTEVDSVEVEIIRLGSIA